MSFLPLSFGLPAVLWGLLALPVIWWLLRLTPPKPQTEVFPPLRILAQVLKREETPNKSPWWLTLLRLALAALLIAALAEPVWNPRERVATSGSSLALVIDNGWASALDWRERVATAERLINDAKDASRPVILAFTADKPNAEIGPFEANAALDRLRAAEAQPVPVNRDAVYARVAGALGGNAQATVALLTDGLATGSDAAGFERLRPHAAEWVWAAPGGFRPVGLTASANEVDGFELTAVRAATETAPRQIVAGAFDEKGRRIADATVSFAPGETIGTGTFTVPFELRNDFFSVALDGEAQAAAVRVLDENDRRRRVGLLSQAESEGSQPLLSPLYYIRRALQPFADLVETGDPDLARAVPDLIARKPAIIIMADIGTLPESAHKALAEWVRGGGTLVRFAGPRLAAAGSDDDLLPVRLRGGERQLGGTLSWTEPQPVAEFPAAGPFAGLSAPRDVHVERQVLAEPSAEIAERTWASLADGTPLVTGARAGRGTVALFHVTPEATWSNLPISGSFVDMLRRIVQLSRNQGTAAAEKTQAAQALKPFRMIAANGALVPPGPDAKPLTPGASAVSVENPPGLYGGAEGVEAHNLLPADAVFAPIQRPAFAAPVTELTYGLDESLPLKGPFFTLAFLLLALDTLLVMALNGAFSRRGGRGLFARRAAAGAAAAALAAIFVLAQAGTGFTQDAKPGDDAAVAAIEKTRLGYVVTGDNRLDEVSRAGLSGLTQFLIDKTALEPGEPAAVDIAKDELAFYPLLYWPVDAGSAMPSEAAMARIDAYMRDGGTVLFDTRDQFSTGFDTDNSPANERLRDILADLNVPPLEPVPEDHVLTKSFFILNEFPGRYSGSPLWVEASLDAQTSTERPVRTGDGVSPILITGNDFAGAWAVDGNGNPMFPTVPDDPMQRVYAFRAGVNIMMYMLTGNYKSDQVHVPALLERLGQ